MITNKLWLEIPEHYQICDLDEFVIMPNHFHGILTIKEISNEENRNEDIRSLQKPENIISNADNHSKRKKDWSGVKSGSLSSILRGFKIGVTKWCHKNNHEYFSWQKSFYDHIIRDEKSLIEIRDYIRNNPIKWEFSKNSPENLYM